jgi:hypothetical protein
MLILVWPLQRIDGSYGNDGHGRRHSQTTPILMQNVPSAQMLLERLTFAGKRTAEIRPLCRSRLGGLLPRSFTDNGPVHAASGHLFV